MRRGAFRRRSRISVSATDLLEWHLRPGALERLIPPWERAEVEARSGEILEGGRVTLRILLGPFRLRWVAEHSGLPGELGFEDVQVRGPFAVWEHTHRMLPGGDQASLLEDRVEFALPLGWLGGVLGREMVRRKLDRTFAFRHQRTQDDLAAHRRAGGKTMRVVVSGSSGLLGSALVAFLGGGGHQIVRLVRRPAGPGEAQWDPGAGSVAPTALEGSDAVVHLAGESIAAGRWTPARKARIRDSRVRGTRALAEAVARLVRPPRVMVCASAIGYYGDRGDEVMREDDAPGGGFLAEVCREWEEAAAPAAAAGVRVVHLRFGVVLSPQGGALARMLTPFRLGLGGPVGPGSQYMSWISLDDAVGAIHHALLRDEVVGPVNAVSPEPVTNREFGRALGSVLRRPAFFPMPAFVARLVFGEMADELLLASTRAVPTRLQATGYPFLHPNLEGAFRFLLGRPG